MVFTTLAHHMDEAFLTEALHQLRKDAAAGIDEVTVAEYSQNLKENIADLHQRLVNRKYRAQPARRVWIPKSDGSQRALAILVLEDKIVQRAVAMLLEAVYEPHFHAFSHGFRRQHSAHGAWSSLRDQCLKLGINWIKGGIHLTQVTPTGSSGQYGHSSAAGCGTGLPADVPAVSGVVRRRRGMPAAPVAVPLARWLCMPTMREDGRALDDGTRLPALSGLRSGGFGHRRHDLRGDSHFFAHLVQCDVVCDQSERWGQRLGD